jgi:4-hydroxybutyrate CoA-transferase
MTIITDLPSSVQTLYHNKKCSLSDVAQYLQSNTNIFIHSVAATPQRLLESFLSKAKNHAHIKLYHLHTEGSAFYAGEEYKDHIQAQCFFIGKNIREAVQQGRADYIPIFLSEIASLFRRKEIILDVALIKVSPPNKHGYCSLGTSVDVSLAAIETAKIVLAEINPHVPWIHGHGHIHLSQIQAFVETQDELPTVPVTPTSAQESQIGLHVAGLVEDQATLQLGIGQIPNAVCAHLSQHRDLGIHTEMFSDGVLGLWKTGAITGKYKKKHPGKMVTSFVLGTKELYQFVDQNPEVLILESSYTNDTHVIRQNPKVTAINSALEIDLTGQICADSLGTQLYSGVGGQMDFIRGACLSEGGRPIIALPSQTHKGQSRLVANIRPGAGVVTTRAHVHYIVTEFGVANLYGKSLKERAQSLIQLAHPQHRDSLARDFFHHYHIHI